MQEGEGLLPKVTVVAGDGIISIGVVEAPGMEEVPGMDELAVEVVVELLIAMLKLLLVGELSPVLEPGIAMTVVPEDKGLTNAVVESTGRGFGRVGSIFVEDGVPITGVAALKLLVALVKSVVGVLSPLLLLVREVLRSPAEF